MTTHDSSRPPLLVNTCLSYAVSGCRVCEPEKLLCILHSLKHRARRLTAYKLAISGSRMPGAADGFSLGPDNVYFRTRLRQAHPETEDAMREQRRACLEVRPALTQDTLWTIAENDVCTEWPGHQLPGLCGPNPALSNARNRSRRL